MGLCWSISKLAWVILYFCVFCRAKNIFVEKNKPDQIKCPPGTGAQTTKWTIWDDGNKEIGVDVNKTKDFRVNKVSQKQGTLNLTLISKTTVEISCFNSKKHNFMIYPIYNNVGNLNETGYAIAGRNYTLKCEAPGGSVIWFAEDGEKISKFISNTNQDHGEYFKGRQESFCKNNICTLTIINITLNEDMTIFCSANGHRSSLKIVVYVLPKPPSIKAISNSIPVENMNKTYECLVKDTKPKYSIRWNLIKKDGSIKDSFNFIENIPRKSGILTSLQSKLTLTLKKDFDRLQCIAFLPNLPQEIFENPSQKLNLSVKYAPSSNLSFEIPETICTGDIITLKCDWKDGDPAADVTLIYNNISNTSRESVELIVKASKSQTEVKCQGQHIAANVTSLKNFSVYYPPEKININAEDEPFLEGKNGTLECKATGGYPENYTYMWKPDLENLFLLNRSQDNKAYTCFASNICNKNDTLQKIHYLKVQYKPIISVPTNITVIENKAVRPYCVAQGNPKPTVKLEYQNQTYSLNELLKFNRKTKSDLYCVAEAKSKKHGILKSRKKITVVVKFPPKLTIFFIKEGAHLIVNCTAFGGNIENFDIKLEQWWGNVKKQTFDKNILSTNNNYINTGTWWCKLNSSNFETNVSSVHLIKTKPIFKMEDNNKEASNGDSVIFKQCFYSNPASTMEWIKDNETIDSKKYLTITLEAGNFPSAGNCAHLEINNIKKEDFGNYTLIVKNTEGESKTSFTLSHKKTTEKEPLGIILGCTFAIIVLCIILGLLIYKCYKLKKTKRDDEFSSTEAIQSANSTEQLTQPKATCNIYATVNESKKEPDDVGHIYALVNKSNKKPDVSTGNDNDIYENNQHINNKPEPVKECVYADLDFNDRTKESKLRKKQDEDQTIYADINMESLN
ncbi:uncharacterized protein LOC115212114 [Argonauta hians]